jgi:hypothetical protein
MYALRRALGAGLCAAACIWMTPVSAGTRQAGGRKPYLESFEIRPGELGTVGENRYFILKPGYQLKYQGKQSGKRATLVITVLDETKTIGVTGTRVMEERESVGGELVEISRNYLAISQRSGDVYYLGEDVDIYKDGKIVDHEGAWLHGSKGASLGLMMPGTPALGLRYYMERAAGVAMDRAEIVSLSERISTPAGTFEQCLKTRETSPLEPLVHEFKVYAPGIGLVKDSDLELVSYGYIKP